MAISNNLVKGSLAICKTELAIIIWPVEEMGKNSVKPSIIEITMVSKMVIIVFWGYLLIGNRAIKDSCKDWKELREKKSLWGMFFS
jgi:hypothetical protein